jgi:DNA-binding transcriptional ArsR family regulator
LAKVDAHRIGLRVAEAALQSRLHACRIRDICDTANILIKTSSEDFVLESMRQFKAGVFQALAHPTRIAIVEHLSRAELSVGQLCDKVRVEQANASQHLAILRSKHIVETRRVGNQTFYRLHDPAFGKVLEALRDYFLSHIAETVELLRLEQSEVTESPARSRIRRRDARAGKRR